MRLLLRGANLVRLYPHVLVIISGVSGQTPSSTVSKFNTAAVSRSAVTSSVSTTWADRTVISKPTAVTSGTSSPSSSAVPSTTVSAVTSVAPSPTVTPNPCTKYKQYSSSSSLNWTVRTPFVPRKVGSYLILCHSIVQQISSLTNLTIAMGDNITISTSMGNPVGNITSAQNCIRANLPSSFPSGFSFPPNTYIYSVAVTAVYSQQFICGQAFFYDPLIAHIQNGSLIKPTGSYTNPMTVTFNATFPSVNETQKVVDLIAYSNLDPAALQLISFKKGLFYGQDINGTVQLLSSTDLLTTGAGTSNSSNYQPYVARLPPAPNGIVRVAFYPIYIHYPTLLSMTQAPRIDDFALSTVFIYFPPVLQSAEVLADGITVFIVFDKSVSLNSSLMLTSVTTIPCAEFLNQNVLRNNISLLAYNKSEDCLASYGSTQATIRMVFKSNLLLPGDVLTLNNNTIKSMIGDELAGMLKFRINPPKSVLTNPLVQLSGNPFVVGCDNLTFTVAATGAGVNRSFVSASISIQFANGTVSSVLNDLSQVFTKILSQDLSGRPQVLSLPSSNIFSDSYILAVSFTNFLNATGKAVANFTRVTDESAPRITISGLPSSWDRPEYQPMLTAIIATTSNRCRPLPNSTDTIINPVPSNTIVMTWTIWSSSDTMSFSSRGFQLKLDVSVLLPQTTYTANFVVDNGVGKMGQNISFTTPNDEFLVSLGGSRTMSTARIPVLPVRFISAFKRFDLLRNMTYTWSCTDTSTSNPCLKNDGTTVFTVPQRNSTAFLDQLSPGVYAFNVNVTCLNTGAFASSADMNVTLVSGDLPTFSIVASRLRPSWTDPFFALTIVPDNPNLLANKTLSSSLSISWSSLSSCNGLSSNYVNMTDSSLFVTSPILAAQFKPFVLTPGGTYCISVNVTRLSTNQSALGITSFTVRSIPSYGSCSISGYNSTSDSIVLTERKDQLTLSCSGWITDSFSSPVMYGWEFKRRDQPSNARPTPLVPITTKADVSISPLAGDYLVRAIIMDAAGARAADQRWYNVLILRNQSVLFSQTQTIASFMTNATSSFGSDQDTASLLANLAVISSSVSSLKEAGNITSTDASSIQVSGIQSMKSLISDPVYASTGSNVAGLSTLLRSYIGNKDNLTAKNANTTLIQTGANALWTLVNTTLKTGTTFDSYADLNNTLYENALALESLTKQYSLSRSFESRSLERRQVSNGTSSTASQLYSTLMSLSRLSSLSSSCGGAMIDLDTPDIALSAGSATSDTLVYKEFALLAPLTTIFTNLTAFSCMQYTVGRHLASGLDYPIALDYYAKRSYIYPTPVDNSTGKITSPLVGSMVGVNDMVYFLTFLDDNGFSYTSLNVSMLFRIELSASAVTSWQVNNLTTPMCARFSYGSGSDASDPSTSSLSFDSVWTNQTIINADGTASVFCTTNTTSSFVVVFVLRSDAIPTATDTSTVLTKLPLLMIVSIVSGSVACLIAMFLTGLFIFSKLKK